MNTFDELLAQRERLTPGITALFNKMMREGRRDQWLVLARAKAAYEKGKRA